ncbi:MAG: hypothetical protein S4CHLAM81_04120 [Chlamydiales bacterium]|nr:hypothetical protein [Chlamydiales bacterium]MCH9635201.1 hypothetical protein [Chlamydiales bacterium]
MGSMLARYFDNLESYLRPGHVLIIFGPRQVGKTTLLEAFLKRYSKRYKLDSGDNIRTQNLLGSQDFDQILGYAEGYDLIALDEAQQIPNIGMALKILVDQRPDLTVIATGSSSFDLAQSVGEPLTGRKKTLTLYPLAQIELLNSYNQLELKERLEDFLLFGGYPDIYLAPTKQEKISRLTELVDSYLLKDILSLEKIKSSKVLLQLVQLLAFQVGQLVSHNELATKLRLDVKTVARYLDLLEKAFVICRLSGYSNNLRNEITKKSKYYFVDLGIRNAVIASFNPLNLRDDVGQLWENFLFIERLKKQTYSQFYGSFYFWRTYNGEEVDFVEEIESQLFGYESKWSTKKKVKRPRSWYETASFEVITPQNYLTFIL